MFQSEIGRVEMVPEGRGKMPGFIAGNFSTLSPFSSVRTLFYEVDSRLRRVFACLDREPRILRHFSRPIFGTCILMACFAGVIVGIDSEVDSDTERVAVVASFSLAD